MTKSLRYFVGELKGGGGGGVQRAAGAVNKSIFLKLFSETIQNQSRFSLAVFEE